MKRRNLLLLALIAILAFIAIYIDLPHSPGLHIGPLDRAFEIKQGLDLQGGLQVLLEADVPPDQKIEPDVLKVAATIIGNRVNGLGVVEPLVQTQGDRRIIVELPGVEDAKQAIATIKETGLLEFIDAGDLALPPGTVVQTTFPLLESQGATTQFLGSDATGGGTPTGAEPTPMPPEIEPPSLELTPSQTTEGMPTSVVSTEPITPSETTPGPALPDWIFATILTGAHLKTAWVDRNSQTGELEIAFELTDVGGPIFAEYTGRNIGKVASIVLDKEVISSPVIQSEISDGRGVIQGSFDLEEAQHLVVQLRYGSLPIPLRVETTRSVGPTLGQDSVQRSIQAGVVGLTIVLIFMLVYYRLPGFLANLALILYGLVNFAVYKAGWPVLLVISLLMIASYLVDRRDIWPLLLGGILLFATAGLAIASFAGVTLTLPAITGFILSTGMAVDANILVFERMKEELRLGRSLGSAIEAGFSRAWTSIRDSNISTIITCIILYLFGTRFGAGAVQGFAVTLALGVVINIFTAITVTRTFIRLVFDRFGDKLQTSKLLLGA